MRRATGLINLFIIIVTLGAAAYPASWGRTFSVDPSVAAAMLSIGVAVFLYRHTRLGKWDLSFLSRAAGIAMFLFTAVAIYTPTLAGLRDTYLPTMDMLLTLEAGILLLIVSLEPKPNAIKPSLYLPLVPWALPGVESVFRIPRAIGGLFFSRLRWTNINHLTAYQGGEFELPLLKQSHIGL